MTAIPPKSKSTIVLLSLLLFSCGKSPEEKYDEETGQPTEILTNEGIDEALSTFETISYTEMDASYISYSDPRGDFYEQLKGKTYTIVRGDDIYKRIVGKYRIKDFLPSDKYQRANENDVEANKQQYWLIDKKVLYMLLEFILVLDEKGYDKYGFRVRESHRHPLCNKLRGGASKSQHINGCAIDMVVQDINKDGEENQDDKTICLDILEPLVGSRGGIGKYPGTMTIHIDTRGYAARWDSY